uniref:Glycine-rich protein n=1 Tax=Panagrolaimus sp. ES5 TaxID=591445 RepID=A0AC34GYC0_9BILA
MPYIDSKGKLVDKPQGILQGYSFNGILEGILTFFMAIIAFFQSMILPLFGRNASSSDISRFFGGRGGGGSGRGDDDRRSGPGGGGGGGGNRPIGRLNTTSMDSTSSCPTGGCSGGGCG